MTLFEEAIMMLDQLKGRDERTDELIEEAVKRIQADYDALMEEVEEARRFHAYDSWANRNSRPACNHAYGLCYGCGADPRG